MPTLLSLWPPEIGNHSQPPSSPLLITYSCLRPTSTDTFNSYPAHKSPLLPLFTMEGPTKAFRGCTFLVYQYHKKTKKKNTNVYIVFNNFLLLISKNIKNQLSTDECLLFNQGINNSNHFEVNQNN